MTKRANYAKLSPDSVAALRALDKSIAESPLGQTIIDLVKIRASQLNGCLYCLDLHSKDAIKHGERQQRIFHLPLWQESALFSDKEKAALEWTELLTVPDANGIRDADYEELSEYFTEKELSDLTIAISAINAWNRLGIAFRPTPGTAEKAPPNDTLRLV